MAFARLVQKAAKINKLRKILTEEKEYSVGFARKLKICHTKLKFRCRIGRILKKVLPVTEDAKIHMFFYKLTKDGSYENFIFKSLVGFISGFFLTYLFFIIFVFQLNLKFGTATIMCSVIGGILTIGLAFSYKIRCIVLLLLPTCFSKRGRQALLAYAFILSFTGPAKNTLNNMGILNESLTCEQEQLKATLKQLIDTVKRPFYAIKYVIKTVVKTLKNIVKKIKAILLAMKRMVLSIVKVIDSVHQFLVKIFNICNQKVETPFERCSRTFEDATNDCNSKLGPYFNWLCSITYVVQSVCQIVKIQDFLCVLVDFNSNSVVDVTLKKFKNFLRRIKTMFYVKLKFSHSFHFETNQSKAMNEVTAGIATEFKNRTQRLVQIFDIISCAVSFFFILAIIKVVYYRHQFLTSETFDNRYITQDFRLLDLRRAQMRTETVLPLNHRERKKYVSSTSVRLVDSEKKKLNKAAMTVFVATIKITVYILMDYALFWTLKIIRYHARFQPKVKAPNMPILHITGNGFIAKLLRSIVTAFQPIGFQIEIDTIPCLPDPIAPDFDRYIQIASCIVLCWILAILEPYGLRMRHCIMCYYHPSRAKERAVWLYNHIMSARKSFLKFARRKLRRKIMTDGSTGQETLKQFLMCHLLELCPCLKCFKEIKKLESCLLCEEVLQSEPSTAVKCQTPGCPGVYCRLCYDDLKNVCTICQDPLEYGDYSDIDEEKDSSDNETASGSSNETKTNKIKNGKKYSKLSEGSESSTSGYSGNYQRSDRKTTFDLMVYPVHSADIEKQELPTYVSMQSFIVEPESEIGGSTTCLSRSSKPKDRSRRRSERESKSRVRSNKWDGRNKQRSTSNGDDSQDLLELGMYPLREKTNKRNDTQESATYEKIGNFYSALDNPSNSSEYSKHPKIIPTTSTDTTDSSSSTDDSIISELKPLKTRKRTADKAKRWSKSSKPIKKLIEVFKTGENKSEETPTLNSESEDALELNKKLVDRSSTKLQERNNKAKDTSSSLSDKEVLELQCPKSKLIEPHKETTNPKSTQFSKIVSIGTRISENKFRKHHLSIPPPPPSLPTSLQTSQSKSVDGNKSPTTEQSVTKIERKFTEHLRSGEGVVTGNIKKFLTGPKKFRLPVGQQKIFSPMKSLSSVVSELRNVLGEESFRNRKNRKSIDDVQTLPLPPVPTGVNMNQESFRTDELIPEKVSNKCKSDCHQLDKRTSTPKRTEDQQQKYIKYHQIVSTPGSHSDENDNLPTVQERIRAYEATICTQQRLDERNVDSQFDIYFRSPIRNPLLCSEKPQLEVPHLDLISERSYFQRGTLPHSMIDHCNCQCNLPKRVRYQIQNEKERPTYSKCEDNTLGHLESHQKH